MSKKREARITDRRIMAIGYYYCPELDTYGNKRKSCTTAGYSESGADKRGRQILMLDKLVDNKLPENWKKFVDLLPQITEMVSNWLKQCKSKPETKDIREARGLARLYGDLEGRFEKIVRQINHNIEEKREVKVFVTLEEERKYWQELSAMGDQRVKAIDTEAKANNG